MTGIKESLNKKISIEDIGLYNKNAVAFFFMFVVPMLLTLYIVFLAPNIISDKSRLLVHIRIIIIWMSLSGLFGYVFLRMTIKTLITVIKKVKSLSLGKKGEKIEIIWNDELKDLAQSFNKINATLEAKIKELEYSQRLTRELFQQIGEAITSTQKIKGLLDIIIHGLRKVLDTSINFISLYSNDGSLYIRAYIGSKTNLRDGMRLADNKGVIGHTIKKAVPVIINMDDVDLRKSIGEDIISYSNNIICVPILVKGAIKGVLGAADKAGTQRINEEDVSLLENVAGQIAVCVENLELSRNIEETYYNTLVMLARVVEAKDAGSAGHLERVSSYVQMIAEKLLIEEETKKILIGGALLHDLGKVGIEDAILKKEQHLSPEEYEIMKQHTVIGENILKPLQSMSKLSTLVRHHHEFYDGTGYPDHLKGDEIPLAARILTIADIYDALTTDRSYRKSLSRKEAIDMLRSYSGTKLDPRLVDIFIELISAKEKLK